jgi:hypothetical protein
VSRGISSNPAIFILSILPHETQLQWLSEVDSSVKQSVLTRVARLLHVPLYVAVISFTLTAPA